MLSGALAITAMGLALGWRWARLAGRVVAWLNVLLFAVLLVPDREDAVLNGTSGLHTICGVLAAYFLLCAICLGFDRKGTG